MHISKDVNDFRNDKYLTELRREYLNMFRAYHRFIAYRNKLLNELTLSTEDKDRLIKIDKDFCLDVIKAERRIHKDDFNGALP